MYPLAGLLGMLMGSLSTMMCYRIPREIPLGLTSHTRSCCPHCQQVIPWQQNIPLFSYLFLRGRCGSCKEKIPLRYLLIELTTTVLFIFTVWVYGQSTHQPLDPLVYWAELAKVLYFVLALITTTFIDLEFRIIPDRFSIGGFVVAMSCSLFWGIPPFFESLAGAAFGFGVFWLMAWGYEKLKGIEGLGFGDVKMMAWLGAWVGLQYTPFVILIASVSGALVGLLIMRLQKSGMQTAIPFGPFLAFGAYAAWVISQLSI